MSRAAAAALFAPVVSLCLMTAYMASAEDYPLVLGYDLSTRSAALGGASNALFWGEELNSWGNPSLLGEAQGIRFTTSHMPVSPFLTDRASFQSTDLVVGADGLGFVLSGRPRGLGRVVLDYGIQPVLGSGGYPTTFADAFESVDSWGFGVSVLQAIRTTSRLWGADFPKRDRFDVSFGMNFKNVASQHLYGYPQTTRARDWGMLLRATPMDNTGSTSRVSARFDLAGGISVLSYNDDATLPGIDGPTPISQHARLGASARVALDPPQLVRASQQNSSLASWLDGLRPLLSVGLTTDHEARGTSYTTTERYTGWGAEVSFARVFSIRRGHTLDKGRYWPLEGSTSGWSVGLPIGRWAGFMVEDAHFPQPLGSAVGALHRRATVAWIDPIAFARSRHHRAQEARSPDGPH